MLIETGKAPTAELTLSPAEKILNGIQDVLSYYQDRGLDARLIGSLGRQASLRTQNPIVRVRSDIDILLLNTDENTPAIIRKVQQIVKHDVQINFFLQKEEKSFIKYRDILVEIDPIILQLRIGSLAGRLIHTLDPNLLFHLTALYLSMRPKDKISSMKYAREIRKNGDCLPEELFKPFHTLMDLKKERYPLDTIVGQLQYFYLKKVPKPLSYVLTPMLGEIKRIYVNL